jgi:hypothetical protein
MRESEVRDDLQPSNVHAKPCAAPNLSSNAATAVIAMQFVDGDGYKDLAGTVVKAQCRCLVPFPHAASAGSLCLPGAFEISIESLSPTGNEAHALLSILVSDLVIV